MPNVVSVFETSALKPAADSFFLAVGRVRPVTFGGAAWAVAPVVVCGVGFLACRVVAVVVVVTVWDGEGGALFLMMVVPPPPPQPTNPVTPNPTTSAIAKTIRITNFLPVSVLAFTRVSLLWCLSRRALWSEPMLGLVLRPFNRARW